MPDLDKLDQCVMLSRALWFLRPPARAPFAEGLYKLGVRMHPELATEELVASGAPGLGEHRPQRVVNINSARDGMAVVRSFAPDLAAKMDAATTEQQKQTILGEIRAQHADMIARAEQQLGHLDGSG